MNKDNNHKLTENENFKYLLYIGPNKDNASLVSACSSFKDHYGTNTTNYETKVSIIDNDKLLFEVDAHTNKKFKYDDYNTMRKSLRTTRIRTCYCDFCEHLSGTFFIDYLYVAIVKIDSIKDVFFPFIINGPYLNISKTTCELQHYIHCLPLVWFPFIPNTSIKSKNIKSEYLDMYGEIIGNKYKLSDLTLLEISLEDDFHVPRIKTVYDNNALYCFTSYGDRSVRSVRSVPLPTFLKEMIINKNYTFATISDGKEYLESSIALWKKDT